LLIKKQWYLHKNLRAIDHNLLLSQLTPNMYAQRDEVFLHESEIIAAFEQYPQIIKNTQSIIDNCKIDFDFDSPKNKKQFTGSRYDDKILLEKLTYDGMKYRYGKTISRQQKE